MTKRIAIIGAGCSGLTAIKTCIDEGYEPVCFERENDIGGLWNYSEEVVPGRANTYHSCVINTCKEMMAFSDFPVPADFPVFLPHKKVLEYFRLYVSEFNLLRYIKFGRLVECIKPSQDYDDTGRWNVYTRQDSDVPDGLVQMDIFDAVMVCNGHHQSPYIPEFEGHRKFKGKIIHSWEYKRPTEFENKNVLVVGIGNSSVDIAVDVSRVANQVYVSTRRGAWIAPKTGLAGIPNDAIGNSRIANCLPEYLLHKFVEKLVNITHFDHENLGVKPQHRGLDAFPTISDQFHLKLLDGTVKIKPNITNITPHRIVFDDDTEIQCDVIIMGTGYNYTMPFLDEEVLSNRENNFGLYKYVYPPSLKHNTLGVIGLVQAIGAVMPISEMQCRWFCRVLGGNYHLPSRDEMMSEVSNKKMTAGAKINSQRHALVTMWIPYMDELAEKIGCKPNLWRMLYSNPRLAMNCFLGPCIPSQYRLEGPMAWPGARNVILKSYTNLFVPTRKKNTITYNDIEYS